MRTKLLSNQLVFVGSSKENSDVAKAIQENLNNKELYDKAVIEVNVWDQGVFRPGDTTLSRFIRASRLFDFAILIFGNDAVVKERGRSHHAARDNVVFELGLMFGILGDQRCFIIKDEKVKLPSDLDGITVGSFRRPQSNTLQAALGSACENIIRRIRDISEKEPLAKHKATLTDQYIEWWDQNNRRTATEIIQTMDGLEISVSPSVFSPDVRLTHSPVVVYKKLPKNLAGKSVLDIGTGCGVLAIAAALREAKHVLAVDVEPQAIENTKDNIDSMIRLGRIQRGVISVIESDVFENVDGKFDYIIANLPISVDAQTWKDINVQKTIRSCVKGLKKHLKKGGKAIFAWASFGPPKLIPDLLRKEGFICTTHTEETFGAHWHAHVARYKDDK